MIRKRHLLQLLLSLTIIDSLTACGAARTNREKVNLTTLTTKEICYAFNNPKDGFEKEAARQLMEEKGLWKNEECIFQYTSTASNADLFSSWAFGTRNHKYIAKEIESKGLTGQNCAELIAAKQAASMQATQASQNFYKGLTGLGMSMMQQGTSLNSNQQTDSGFHSYMINGRQYNCSTLGTVTNCTGN